jgi:adenylyltransferase/sulfurtransferase
VTELVDYEYFCGLGLAVQETSAMSVPQLSVQALSAKLAEGHRPLLIDVREPTEWDIVRIPQSCLRSRSSNLAKELVDEYGADAEMIIVCKSGQRSQAVAAELQALGVHKAHNLIGGVVAWVSEIDPALPSY